MKTMADERSKAIETLAAKKGAKADNKFFGVKKEPKTGGPLKAATPKTGGKLKAQYMKKKLKAKVAKKAVKVVAKKAMKLKKAK